MINFIDKIFTADAFSKEGIEIDEVEEPREPKIELRLSLTLQIKLDIEQRPILSLGTDPLPEQRLELQQLLALQFTILRMDDKELLEFMQRYNADKGQKATTSILRFVATYRVKKAKPNLSWKQAREMTKKLSRKIRIY